MNSKRQPRRPVAPSAGDYLIASKQCELMHLQHFLQMGKLIQSISNLVHGLQQERGASNVFLGSGGTKFGNERQGMIRESESRQLVFNAALAEVHESLTEQPVSPQLLNHIASAVHGLETLSGLRRQVECQNLTAVEATEAYSRLIQGLITVVFEAADTAVDPTIAGLLVAMVHLMNGKEFCGQERAAGSAGFSSGGFDAALSRRMMHLVEAQERCFEVFVSLADADSRALWYELRSHPREADLERFRRLGWSVGPHRILDRELADQWFGLMTERMDALKKVEDAVESCFHARCVDRFGEARNSLAHQETLLATLDEGGESSQPMLVLCSSGESWQSDGVGQQFGRSILELVQEQTRRLQQMTDELQVVKETLEDRRTQEKAVLLLMKHRQIDNDEAHRVLRKLAMDQGRKLPEVARALVSMADVLN
ncbi:nitrate regulatory protein NasR [Marinobacter szutsaonensis]